MKRLLSFIIFISLAVGIAMAQQQTFTRADTLRGMLLPERTCYDVKYYHLDVKVDTLTKSISGSNTILFEATRNFDMMQVDLFANMKVDGIELVGSGPATWTREFGAVHVKLPVEVKKGSLHLLRFVYSGSPQIALNPPWGGGFTWTHNAEGDPWICVTCQGTGASLWWPNKDHQADEVDSMLISITVPSSLEDISNGRLRARTNLGNGWTRYDWFVANPINNYNVTVNIGKFAHWGEVYHGEGATYPLDYYVMPENLAKAKKQFTQVKSMLKCFEKDFGPYPWPEDGYKLIESPHNGMEHQSAVAYGNGFENGYRGRASSAVGLKFDFIIVHESAHEWWGNSITSKDIADMWIHESFGAYAEALYVECMWGREQSLKYINGKKTGVRNDRPIIGTYNVQNEGSGDMYNKGQLVLNTLRSVIDNDKLWFSILRGLQKTFRHQTVTADDIFNYINAKTGTDYSYFFDQYLKHTKIPTLQIFVIKKGDTVMARYRWQADVQDFHMPVKVTISPGKYDFIQPTASWGSTVLHIDDPADFKVAEDLFYINLDLHTSYLVENPIKPHPRN